VRICALTLCVLIVLPRPAAAYLELSSEAGGQNVPLRWTTPSVRWYATELGVPGVSASDFQAAVARAFATWEAVPTATIAFQFGGFTSAAPFEDDSISVLGFAPHPEMDRVLAETGFVVDDITGDIVESDIFFNSAFPWSVSDGGQSGRFDLESIALHEIGHLSGLGHSALGETELVQSGGRRVLASEAVMFPIAFASGSIAGRTLKADDIAGISDLYPDGDFSQTGSISGRVTKGGQPVFGAHVVAFDPATGLLVGNFTLSAQGEFSIAGLSSGPHLLRVEPLDDADLDSFFDSTRDVDLDFRVTYLDRLVIVPRRGDAGAVAIEVARK
jgi:matrixin